MDAGVWVALVSLLLGGVLLAGGLFGAWTLGRVQAERNALDAHDDDESDVRLAHVERMIEAMALDMERLAEAQRFLARRLPAAEPETKKREIPASLPRV